MKCKKGFKQKGDKCVKAGKKGFFKMSNKKSPFRMWGSWIGVAIWSFFALNVLFNVNDLTGLTLSLVIGFFPFLVLSSIFGFGFFNFDSFIEFNQALSNLIGNGLTITLIILLGIVYSFLIGWGIQSLIKRFKK